MTWKDIGIDACPCTSVHVFACEGYEEDSCSNINSKIKNIERDLLLGDVDEEKVC